MKFFTRLLVLLLLAALPAHAQSVSPDQRPMHGTPFKQLPDFPSTQVNPRSFVQTPVAPANANPLFPTNAYIFNASPTFLRNLTACLASVKMQISNCNMAWIGDSVMTGAFATASDFATYSIPSIVSYTLNQNGIPSSNNNAIGFSVFTADPRISFPSGQTGWACGASPDTLGGAYCENSTNTNPINFTPTQPVDTIIIKYMDAFGATTCAVTIDGVAQTGITVGGSSNNYASATYTVPLGLHTISTWTLTGGCHYAGFVAYDSSQKQVLMINGAWNGSQACQWTDASVGYSFLNAFGTYSPKITFIMPGINDWNAQTDINSYKNCIQTVITKAKATGDVVLITSNPSQNGGGGGSILSVQQQYVMADYQLAISNNIPLIDTWSAAGSWEIMTSLGMEFNALHPNGVGMQWFAGQVSNLILAAAGPSAPLPNPDTIAPANYSTASNILAPVPGLSFNVAAGATYRFKAVLNVTADATGGHQYSIGGTATATSTIFQINSINNSSHANVINSSQSSLGGAAGQAGATAAYTVIEGTITVNTAGTLAVEFAQNVANGTSSVLAGSTFSLTRI